MVCASITLRMQGRGTRIATGKGVGVAKSLEIGHPSKNWNARFGQELLVLSKKPLGKLATLVLKSEQTEPKSDSDTLSVATA